MHYVAHQTVSTFSYSYNQRQQSQNPSSTTAPCCTIGRDAGVDLGPSSTPPPPYHEGRSANVPNRPVLQEVWTVPLPAIYSTPSEPPPPYSVEAHESNFVVQHPQTTTNLVTSRTTSTAAGTVTSNSNQSLGITKPINFQRQYLTTSLALLKVLEFVVCMIAFSTSVYLRNKIDLDLAQSDRIGYFIFLLIACCLFAALLFWLSLIGVLDRYDSPSIARKMFFVHFLLSLLLMIASSLLRSLKVCAFSRKMCPTYDTAAICGFIAAGLFTVDAGIQYKNHKQR